MTIAEIKERLGMNSRAQKVKCYRCGKTMDTPNMYGKDLELLKPYCCTATVLTVQWLIHHGWHITTYEANPPGGGLTSAQTAIMDNPNTTRARTAMRGVSKQKSG